MRITLEEGEPGTFILISDDGQEVLIQEDWDCPDAAAAFGWMLCCGSNATDGTVDCPDCGATAEQLIANAYDYLAEHIGDAVDDPGYFD